jgi:hypothetical protein
MTQIPFEALLREGGAALRGGERERARGLLAQAVRLNPRNEQAWLLLAGAVSDPEQRRSCLERVLRLNPEHAIARKAMASLQTAGARRPTADGERPTSLAATASADQPQAPSAGSLLGRLRQPEQAGAPAPFSPQPAPAAPQPLSYEQLLAAAPEPLSAQPQRILPALPPAAPAAASPQPAPTARPSGDAGLIELSAAGVRRKERERRLWMAALAVGVLMMLAGLGLAVLVLLTG